MPSWDLDTYQGWLATTWARLAGPRTGFVVALIGVKIGSDLQL